MDLNRIRKDIFLVASVQHTGTWFIIDFLKGHSEINKLIELHKLRDDTNIIDSINKTIIHTHIDGILVEDRIEKIKHVNYLFAFSLLNTFKSIIPLRDPLASIVTRQRRHPDINHTYLISGFIFLAQLENLNPFFLPIDSKLDLQGKTDLLNNALDFLGLPKEEYVNEYAEKWEAPIYNITDVEHHIRNVYDMGDYKRLKRMLPVETNMLEQHRDILQPFLEKHGYKDLMWW